MTLEFLPGNLTDADFFQLRCIDAAERSKPTLIGDIAYDPADHLERWIDEGNQRTAVNAKTGKAAKNQAEVQRIPNSGYTVDQIGRICEGPIELLLGLDVAAVVANGTDDRPDKIIEGIRFDVKGSAVRPENSFSIPLWQAHSGKYDALLLVQHIEAGRVRVWACKCEADISWQSRPPAGPGKKPFYRIACGAH